MAKSAIPYDGPQHFASTVIEQGVVFPFSFFTAPAGYLVTEELSSILTKHKRDIFWLRLGPEDRDPATLLLSLINAPRNKKQRLNLATLYQMQRFPGDIYGWPALFERLGHEYAEINSHSCAIVLENIHLLDTNPSTLNLAVSHFLKMLPESSARILITHTEFPEHIITNQSSVFGIRDLRIRTDENPKSEMPKQAQLTKDCIRRIIFLSQGRSEVLMGVMETCEKNGNQCIRKALDHSSNLDQLLNQIVRNCLQATAPEEILALSLALELGYFRTETFSEIIGKAITPDGPWLQNLSDGWQRVREIWRPALEHSLHNYLSAQGNIFRQAVDLLAEMGAIEVAIPLYFRLKEYEQASRVIKANIENLMNYGQWETLNGWLSQLPQNVLAEFPQVLYAQGELQAIYGSAKSATHTFIRASEIFSHHGDQCGACRSLLAESTMAIRAGDPQRALLSAQSAHAIASTSNLNYEQAWASCQLGILASTDDKPDFAATHFKNAYELTDDPQSRQLFRQATELAQAQQQAGIKQEYHRQQMQSASQTKQEASTHLLKLFVSPPEKLPEMLGRYGWLNTPLALKLPVQLPNSYHPPPSFFQKLLLKLRFNNSGKNEFNAATTLSPLDLLPPIYPMMFETKQNTFEPAHIANKVKPQPAEEKTFPDMQIMIYCLGPLRVLNNKQFVTDWPSRKAQLIFKYLLLHRHNLAPKEAIMEIFWPDADIESARRNLHQAIYNLRLTLKSIDDHLHIIEFEQDGYRINPEINIWIDHEVFEHHYMTAQHLEHAGFAERAMAEYAIAEEMYMDHLFSDELYEDWMRSQREYLWQTYLSTATWLAEYHFQRKDYPLAISIGQRILQKDRCAETAHQILMRCFHHQGQRQLALRQYEICHQALKEELDVEPSSKTKLLFAELLND